MKPAVLRAVYKVNIDFDVEEIEKALGINWEDVDEWFVKYGDLVIRMNNGSQFQYAGPEMSNYTDWKHPEHEQELDKEYDILECSSGAIVTGKHLPS